MENVTTVGVDLSKNLMHTVFMTSDGKIIKRKKYNTNSFADMIKVNLLILISSYCQFYRLG